MKKSIIIIALAAATFAGLSSCTNNPEQPAQIIVTVTGECICNVFIYSADGLLCLQSKIYDCQETNRLIFNLYQEGTFVIKAEYKTKSTSQTITTRYGATSEIDIVL